MTGTGHYRYVTRLNCTTAKCRHSKCISRCSKSVCSSSQQTNKWVASRQMKVAVNTGVCNRQQTTCPHHQNLHQQLQNVRHRTIHWHNVRVQGQADNDAQMNESYSLCYQWLNHTHCATNDWIILTVLSMNESYSLCSQWLNHTHCAISRATQHECLTNRHTKHCQINHQHGSCVCVKTCKNS